MASLSEYEKRRLKNIEENKRILAELGLDKPFKLHTNAPKRAPDRPAKRKREAHGESLKPCKEQAVIAIDTSPDGDGRPTRRRSARLLGKPTNGQGLLDDEEIQPSVEKKNYEKKSNTFGAISGIKIGDWWEYRADCSEDLVHRATVRGIHGNAREGAFSIALSGGYEDDIDCGEYFTYTGEGGRDLKGTKAKPKNLRTAEQTCDQPWSIGNSALVKSVETGLPVRVIRGFKLRSQFAPQEGYRYDGLYKVEKWWFATGMKGYKVFRFAMKRLENQAPPPWLADKEDATENADVGNNNDLL